MAYARLPALSMFFSAPLACATTAMVVAATVAAAAADSRRYGGGGSSSLSPQLEWLGFSCAGSSHGLGRQTITTFPSSPLGLKCNL